MKKIWNMLIVFMLIGSIIPLALADEAEESSDGKLIDEETEEEVEIMGNKYGSSIRLLQLEKAITGNIVKGNLVIEFLENNTSVNVTELKGFIGRLELLKSEVSSADPNASDAVEVFIDLKHDAINVSKQFRDTLHSLVDNTTLEDIQEQIRNMYNESVVESLGQKIRSHIRLYNSVQLKKMAGYFGKYNSSLIEQYKNGNCNMSQVKEEIKQKVMNMSKGKRKEVYSKIMRLRIRKRVQAQSSISNVSEGFKQRLRERITDRLNKVRGMGNNSVNNAIQKQFSDEMKGKGNGKGGGW